MTSISNCGRQDSTAETGNPTLAVPQKRLAGQVMQRLFRGVQKQGQYALLKDKNSRILDILHYYFKKNHFTNRQTVSIKRHTLWAATENIGQQKKGRSWLKKGGRGPGTAVAFICLLILIQTLSATPVLGAETVYSIDISEQSVDKALTRLSEQVDVQVLFLFDLAETRKANAVKGEYTMLRALDLLLRGTGLSGGLSDKGVLMISARKSEEYDNKRRELMNSKKSILTAVVGALVGVGGVSSPLAQTEGELSRANMLVLEEILVTATKKGRAENIQDVPVAITAINEEMLENMHFENITDIAHSLPNATLDEAPFVPGQASFFIRGVGLDRTNQTTDPAVGVTINGMPLGQALGMASDTFDLESVEVLRGPQGTLFGRNATGGVVVLRTKRPSGDLGFEVKGTLGSDERTDLALMVENSLVDEKLSGKLAVIYKDHNGYFQNVSGTERIGGSRTRILRPTLAFTPSETVDINVFAEYGKIDSGMPALRNINDPGTIFTDFIYTPSSDDLQVLDQDYTGPNNSEWWHLINEVNWDLGSGQLTSVTAYREVETVISIDIDGSNVAAVHFVPSLLEQNQVSQELRYAMNVNDNLDITTGLYYFKQSYDTGFAIDIFGGTTPKNGISDHESYAVFAQAEYALNEDWRLILGGRYTDESKDGQYATDEGGGCDPIDPAQPLLRTNCNYDFVGSESWQNFTPKVGLQWSINDSSQAYISWTKGFRSGGFNNEATTVAAVGPYNEETVEAWEIGLKADIIDDRMRLNLSAFLNDYSDMQRTVLTFFGGDPADASNYANRVFNAGRAEIAGFEAEINYLATERLSLSLTLGLMDAEIKEFNGLDVDGDGLPDPDLARSLDLSRVPDLTYGLALAYDIPLSSGGITLNGSYSYTDERAANDVNSVTLDSVRLLNLNATYETTDGRYAVSVFGKNVLDDVSRLFVDKTAFQHFAQISTPATWGVELTYKY